MYICFILRDNGLFQTAKEVKPRELWLAVGGGFCVGFSGSVVSDCNKLNSTQLTLANKNVKGPP